MNQPQKKKSVLGRIVKVILIILGVIIVAFGGLLGWLTATEFKPADRINIEPTGNTQNTSIPIQGEYSILTWNIGYGALGDNADFFMDGGKCVQTATKDRVGSNLTFIKEAIAERNPDFVFLQEIDRNSTRSHHIDELQQMSELNQQSVFAFNYKVPYVPYPVPPIGTVNSGIATLGDYDMTQSERVQLPCPFSWPYRLGNLKRCLLITRIPVETESGKSELVLINLHLEAYDSGEGKAAQTEKLLEILKEEQAKGNYVIAGGDFNQTFENINREMYPELEGMWHCGSIDPEDFGSDWNLLMDNSVPTCRSLDRPYAEESHDPSEFQYYLIDGFIVSENVEVKSVETLDYAFIATDHNPVEMHFELLP